jgi:hypothetical protein
MLAARLTRARLSDRDFRLRSRPMGAFADSCAIPSTTHTVPARNEGTRSKHGATPSPTLQPSAPVTGTSAERLINTRRSASTPEHVLAPPDLAPNEATSAPSVNDTTRIPLSTAQASPITTASRRARYGNPLPLHDSTRPILAEFTNTKFVAVSLRSSIYRVLYSRVVRVTCVKPTHGSAAWQKGAHSALLLQNACLFGTSAAAVCWAGRVYLAMNHSSLLSYSVTLGDRVGDSAHGPLRPRGEPSASKCLSRSDTPFTKREALFLA